MELWEVKNYLVSPGVDKNKIDETIKSHNYRYFFMQYNVLECIRCGKWYIKYQTGSDGKCNGRKMIKRLCYNYIKRRNLYVKEKFEMVLQKDEELKWSNKSNVIASMIKGLIPAILFGGFISLFGTLFFGTMFFSENWTNGPDFTPILIILPIIVICYIFYAILDAKNTYFCITDKRIIKRAGAFNNNFIHYTLKMLERYKLLAVLLIAMVVQHY